MMQTPGKIEKPKDFAAAAPLRAEVCLEMMRFFLIILFKALKRLRESSAILLVDPLDAVLPLDKPSGCYLLGKRGAAHAEPS